MVEMNFVLGCAWAGIVLSLEQPGLVFPSVSLCKEHPEQMNPVETVIGS